MNFIKGLIPALPVGETVSENRGVHEKSLLGNSAVACTPKRSL